MSNKYKTLIGSLLILAVLGSVYAWSLFNKPLAEHFQTDISQVAFTFGVMSLALAVGASVAGFLKLRIGITNVVILSAVLVGSGLIIAAFAPNTIFLYLSAGVLLGLGDGLGYMVVLTNCVRFFPERKGLVSALSIGAYGGGSLLFKYIDSYLIAESGLQVTLLVWGLIATIIIAFGAMLTYDSINAIKQVQRDNKNVREFDLKISIKFKQYWYLTIMFFIDCMCGLYVIGVVSDIGTSLLNLPYEDAATAVAVVAIANISGRLVMGVLSDKLPRIRLITFDQVLSLIALLLILIIENNQYIYYSAVALIAFSFGGTLTIYPSIISDYFGLKNFAKNYGLLYLGFGFGSLSGSIIGLVLGSFTATFVVIAALVVVAIVVSLLVKTPSLKETDAVFKKAKEDEIRSEENAREKERELEEKEKEVLEKAKAISQEYAEKDKKLQSQTKDIEKDKLQVD